MISIIYSGRWLNRSLEDGNDHLPLKQQTGFTKSKTIKSMIFLTFSISVIVDNLNKYRATPPQNKKKNRTQIFLLKFFIMEIFVFYKLCRFHI